MRQSVKSRCRRGAGLFLLLGWVGACSSFGGNDAASSSGGGDDGGMADGSTLPPIKGSAPFTLTVKAPAVIQTGTSADIEVSVVRDGPMGFGGDIHLELQNLPDVTAQAVDITPDHQTATMTVAVGPNRKNGQTPFVIRGTSGDSAGSTMFSALLRGPVGSLDTSFGTSGIFSLDESSEATALFTDAGGGLYVAGRVGADIGVVALTDDGGMNASYGASGIARQNIGMLGSTYNVTTSPPNFFFYSNITTGGVPSTVIAKLTPSGLDVGFGSNGIATIGGLQSASAAGLPPPAVGLFGTLVAGRPDSANASSTVMLVNADGTANATWPSTGRMAVSNNCGGATPNDKCGPRVILPQPMSESVYQCVNNLLSSTILSTSVFDNPGSQTTLPGFCSDIVRTTFSGIYVAGSSARAQVFHIAGSGVDTMFDGLAPAASKMVIAKKLVTRGDGSSFIVAVEAENASHTAMGVWRLDAAGKTDLTFNPPNGFTVAPIAGTDVTVTSMIIDSQDRILVAGSNGHMVVARFWQ